MTRQGDKPPSWSIYSKLAGLGVAGIITPSYAKNTPEEERNLVFWRWTETPPHKVVVIDDLGMRA